MIEITDKKNCCGCTACISICPSDAIRMEADSMGFEYPKVDNQKCVRCGLCNKVCPFNKPVADTRKAEDINCIVACNKDIETVMTSRSGGVFSALCIYIIAQGGVVYGVGFTDKFLAMHKRAESLEKCDEFKGSKYVQSDKTDIFLQVYQDLKKDFLVLFSGTGCEIAGLKSFLLRKHCDLSKLLLVDIVCHGVPSPRIWQEYLNDMEKGMHKTIKSVDFRDKKGWGWGEHKERIDWMDGTYTYGCAFSHLFCNHIIMRPSCGVCPFANVQRQGDITLADGWGWEKLNSDINSNDSGVSLVISNTTKGQIAWNNIKEEFNYVETMLNNMMQPNLKSPTILNSQSDVFQQEYESYGFNYVKKKYCRLTLKEYLKWHLRCTIRRMKGGVK